MTTTNGCADRAEWELRFAAQFTTRGIEFDTPAVAARVIAAELESWPENEDGWLQYEPEEAADEQLSYWEDDGE